MTLGAQLAAGLRAMPRLGDEPLTRSRSATAAAPRVSIVVAARDEAAHVAAAVHTLLAQDYPDFEVVAVNDRSSDGTGELLERLAAHRPRLRVVHVSTLPPGWLGKNHALQTGAEVAGGELLLFTDADVLLRPDALWRAVSLMDRLRLDHLAVAPRIHAGSAWANIAVAVFLLVFSIHFRPWKAADPGSRHHIGIGAFNLVRAEAYRAIGGHRAIALRPDDDLRLGRRLKRSGHRQAAAMGVELATVEWYPSLRAMARGLRKNSFAVVEYRIAPLIAGTALPVIFDFWPPVALAVTGGATWWLNLAVVGIGVASTWDVARRHALPGWLAWFYPLGALFLLWMVWSAALRTLMAGGIDWRGTHYRLDELRDARGDLGERQRKRG